jgi:hypothetical protein
MEGETTIDPAGDVEDPQRQKGPSSMQSVTRSERDGMEGEGEEKTEEDVATDLPDVSSPPTGKPGDRHNDDPRAYSLGKTIEDSFRLTRQNLTAIPAAAADGFWYTKDRIEESGGIVVYHTTELLDVRNWRCIAASALMTCSFYTCLFVSIPVLIIIVLVLTIWRHDTKGGDTIVGNITEPFRELFIETDGI